ncbi:hypothetical protein B0H15DRAFT_834085 [Mycena belliarum]|uniref:Uncharacterized protein n=1 Tax=Mycena belliarum TaxID=1033014 RepID=A0AAD6U9P9_9AGAR|nr:hypothetical protein B0H15DRAFT_834085 [Mycena belliae]
MKSYGTVHYISGLNDSEGRFYALRKSAPAGDQLIVIQAVAVVPESNLGLEVVERCSPDWWRQFDYGLEIIQTLLQQIDFGRTTCRGYLIGPPNSPRIVFRPQCLPAITEIPWCPLVEERDIEITKWVFAEDRHGVWNGKEVDLFMGWDASNRHFLQRIMAGYRLLMERNLEHLTYRALGHVVRNGTSEICGIMTEPGYGRMVERSDKSAVYKAIAQIERAGLIYRGIDASNIIFNGEGQIHLLYISALARQPMDSSEQADELAHWHWERLENLFKELEAAPNPIPPPRKMQSTPIALPYFPAPEHGPKLILCVTVIVHDPDSMEKASGVDDARLPVQRHARPRDKSRIVEALVFDAPATGRSLGPFRPKIYARTTIPYGKANKLVQELLWAQNWPNGANRLTS